MEERLYKTIKITISCEDDMRKTSKSNKQTRKRNTKQEFHFSDYKEIWLFLVLAICVFIFCSNLGMCGIIGKVISGFFFGIFGWTQYLIPFYVLVVVVLGLYASERPNTKRIIIWLGIAMIAVSFSFQIVGQTNLVGIKEMYNVGKNEKTGGGIIFGGLLKYIYMYIGEVGSIIITALLFVIAFIQVTGISLINLFKNFFTVITIREDYDDYEEYDADEMYEEEIYEVEKYEDNYDDYEENEGDDYEIKQNKKRTKKAEQRQPKAVERKQTTIRETKRRDTNKERVSVNYSTGSYVAPPVSLLQKDTSVKKQDTELIEENSSIIQETFARFGIPVEVVSYVQGPTVTRYELQVDSGVKLDKLDGYSRNLMAGLAARSIRIIAPIPGKNTVGIEVPNNVVETVYLSGLIESKEFGMAKSSLSVVIGEDIEGRTIIGDIEKMPHMLVAGCSGSGKSVCLNAILMSILFRSSPEDVRLVIIDPKRVEFTQFFDIPHLLIPVVTDMKKASGVLEWLVNEMENRYMEFEKCIVVNDIYSYNEYIVENKITDENGIPKRRMPQILVIIDEFTDLIMTEKTDIGNYVMRLGQKARAAGIHVILATQRPSKKVIPGEIQSNIPARIALKTTSNTDSRIILDCAGAEELLGNGDLLYDDGTSELIRIQGPFVSKREVKAITDFIKANNSPVAYRQDVENQITRIASGAGESVEGDRDALFEEAAEYVSGLESISIGGLQRRFRIGFNRAARLMDQLYEEGIVGPDNGTKPREVIVDERKD